tara:strand:+ start:147 stop:434 length:288 start_codon:yes stop_codon:yes gene_type:complete
MFAASLGRVMKQIAVSLYLTPQQVEEYYRGRARHVVTRAADGRTVQLPIKVLHAFISKDGIRGEFIVTMDDQNKFHHIDPVSGSGSRGRQLDQLG